MTVTTRGLIGRQDLNPWAGTATKTFTRKNSTGGTDTLTKIGNTVDALAAHGSGVSFTLAALNSALAAIGSDVVMLDAAPGTWTITDDLTIPSNVVLSALPGVNFSITTGKTLTINGAIIAGPYQIFSGAGTVAFGSSNTHELLPHWWGFSAAATGANNGTYLTSALTAANTASTPIRILHGTYDVSPASSIAVQVPILTTGMPQLTVPATMAADYLFDITKDYLRLGSDYLKIQGPGTNGTPSVDASEKAIRVYARDVVLQNLDIYGFSSGIEVYAISGNASHHYVQTKNCLLHSNSKGVYIYADANAQRPNRGKITNSRFQSNSIGLEILYGNTWNITDTDFAGHDESGTDKGVYLHSDVSITSFKGGYFEDNDKHIDDDGNYTSFTETGFDGARTLRDFANNTHTMRSTTNVSPYSEETLGTGKSLRGDTTIPMEWEMQDDTNAQAYKVVKKSVLHSVASAATSTWTNAIPASTEVIGVSARVTTAITGATTWKLGHNINTTLTASDDDAWGTGLAITVDNVVTMKDHVVGTQKNNDNAVKDIILTATGGNFTGGVVRLVVVYRQLIAPTS